MKREIKEKINQLKKTNEHLKTLGVFAVLSVLVTLGFALYNGYLGIAYQIVWNFAIGLYYLVLLLAKSVSVIVYIHCRKRDKDYPKAAFIVVSVLTSVITLAMAYPAVLMIANKREVSMGLIPAIAMAAFTTYKVVSSIRNYLKYKKDKTLYNQQSLVVNVIATIVSVLTIQNTLIIVNGGMDQDMTTLSIVSTIILLVFSLTISILSPIVGLIRVHKEKQVPNNEEISA